MKVTVIGGGNMGLALSSEISRRTDNEVVLYCSSRFDVSELVFYDGETNEEFGDLDFTVETDLKAALEDADYILVTYPSFLRKQFIEKAKDHIKKGSRIGFIPGYGGAEYACVELIEKGVIVFGLQRVPYVARQEGRKRAAVLSRKSMLFIASIPKKYSAEICEDFEAFTGIPGTPLKEYLAVTLAPSNPLLHLTGLYSVFKDYKEGDSYDAPMMFYEEWNDETSKMLFSYDDELQEICSKMKPLDLSEVVSLKIYYESPTPPDLSRKLKSIPSLYEVVTVPLKQEGDKYYPDFGSRMFVEDFPFGIAIIKYFAILTETKTPTIDTILDFYKNVRGICYFENDGTPGKNYAETGVPGLYGLDSLEKIIDFYRK